jgi:putative membrane protein
MSRGRRNGNAYGIMLVIMKKQFVVFLWRWLLNSTTLWAVACLFGDSLIRGPRSVGLFLFGGLVLALGNAVIRPLIVALSLPLIVLSLGLFMFVINGLMVYTAINLTPGLYVTFAAAILISLIMTMVNYLFSVIIEKNAITRR